MTHPVNSEDEGKQCLKALSLRAVQEQLPKPETPELKVPYEHGR